MKYFIFLFSLAMSAFIPGKIQAQQSQTSARSFGFTSHGKEINLFDYKGKVLLIVNTASQCGFSPQYAAMEELYRKYKDKGLVVIAVPANDFGGQEPGDNKEIESFTKKEFSITFPVVDKTAVSGDNAHPFYKWAAAQTGFLGSPKWNFHKYLVGKDGRIIDYFSSTTKPDSENVIAAIEKALAEKTVVE